MIWDGELFLQSFEKLKIGITPCDWHWTNFYWSWLRKHKPCSRNDEQNHEGHTQWVEVDKADIDVRTFWLNWWYICIHTPNYLFSVNIWTYIIIDILSSEIIFTCDALLICIWYMYIYVKTKKDNSISCYFNLQSPSQNTQINTWLGSPYLSEIIFQIPPAPSLPTAT